MSNEIVDEIDKDNKSNSTPYVPVKEYSKKVGNYILNEKIGIGTFSKVTKAIHTLTGEIVAVKILDKSKIKDNIDIERILREIEILKSIKHPNIAQLYESNSTIHNFYLILEYVEGGDLCDYINKNKCLNEHTSCYFFRQLISVIEYLNEMGISHRDIKPENILLDSSQKNIKVIDFGLSNYCADSELLHSACGSPCFASPEMLSGNPYNGITTDIWSSGIVLYSMLVGSLPFDDQELNNLYEQIKIGTFYIPSTLSLEAIDFLKKILRVEPNKRINISQIKKHPWFNIEKNILYKGIDLTVETFPYDEKLIEFVINKYYENDNEINKPNFIKMVQYHACNQYTATYYLTKKFFDKYKIIKDSCHDKVY
jgi:5'-AMP-activated protein kinase catalytic alpha subunit